MISQKTVAPKMKLGPGNTYEEKSSQKETIYFSHGDYYSPIGWEIKCDKNVTKKATQCFSLTTNTKSQRNAYPQSHPFYFFLITF